MMMVQSRFYSLNGTMVKLYVGLAMVDEIQSNELQNEGGESWSAVPEKFMVVSKGSGIRNSAF
jgi:hypothetical protein